MVFMVKISFSGHGGMTPLLPEVSLSGGLTQRSENHEGASTFLMTLRSPVLAA